MNDASGNDGLQNGHRFGVGDIVVYVGAGISLLFVALLLIKVGTDGISRLLLIPSLAILMALAVFAAVGQILSLTQNRWLMVPYGFAALIGVLQVGTVSTLVQTSQALAPGADFFILLGAAACAAGAWMAQKEIGVLAVSRGSSGGNTEEQLRKLKEMMDNGLITEDDYNRKRQDLIAKL